MPSEPSVYDVAREQVERIQNFRETQTEVSYNEGMIEQLARALLATEKASTAPLHSACDAKNMHDVFEDSFGAYDNGVDPVHRVFDAEFHGVCDCADAATAKLVADALNRDAAVHHKRGGATEKADAMLRECAWIGAHACMTGDCSHQDERGCANDLRALVQEIANRARAYLAERAEAGK